MIIGSRTRRVNNRKRLFALRKRYGSRPLILLHDLLLYDCGGTIHFFNLLEISTYAISHDRR